LADLHVVENASAPVIVNLKGTSKSISNRKIKEVKLGDHKDYNLKEMK
jgi:hypothetical protein